MYITVSTEHAQSIFSINVKGTDVVKLYSQSVSHTVSQSVSQSGDTEGAHWDPQLYPEIWGNIILYNPPNQKIKLQTV